MDGMDLKPGGKAVVPMICARVKAWSVVVVDSQGLVRKK
jgi:hypothetical protein